MKAFKSHILYLTMAFVVASIGLWATSCSNVKKNERIITVSIQPQKYLLEKIVGNKFTVMCLLAQDANPETYDPSFSHIINLEKSEAYFRIGNIGFELAIVNKAKTNNPNLKIFDNSKGIPLIYGSHTSSNEPPHPNAVDPHIWSSVANAKIIAKNMLDAIISLDGKNSNYYQRNYNKLLQELNALDADLSKELAPVKGEAFLIWHPSLSYFARDYGLRQINLESEGKEMSPTQLEKEIVVAKKSGAKILFFQKSFDSREIESVNSQIGAKIVTINPMNSDWEAEMRNTADALAKNK
jgi:zinc transport system substrate-binding protein